MKSKEKKDKMENISEEGVVAHVLKEIVVPDIPGVITRGLGFGSIILDIKTDSMQVDGKAVRVFKVKALVPVKNIQGTFKDLNFKETVEKTFGHPLPESPDIES